MKLGGLLMIAMLAFFSLPLTTSAQVSSPVLVSQLNVERKQQQVQELRYSPLLEQAAFLKAQDMLTHGYFSHNSPQGITPWHWFKEVEYGYVNAGENLAIDFNDSHSVHTAWLKSPLHKENMLNGDFTEVGIAVVNGVMDGRATTVVVELFGRPKESANHLGQFTFTNYELNEIVRIKNIMLSKMGSLSSL